MVVVQETAGDGDSGWCARNVRVHCPLQRRRNERNCDTGGAYLVPFLACVDVIVLNPGDVLLDAGKYCQRSMEISGGALSLVKNSTQYYFLQLILCYSI